MEKFRDYYKNKYEKIFKEQKEKLGFIRADVNDGKEANCISFPNSLVVAELEELCINRFNENKALYKNHRKVRHLKFFFNYVVPFAGLAISSHFILTSPRKTDVVPVYNIEQTTLCNGKMIQDLDRNEYIVTDYVPEESEDKYIVVDNVNTVIQYEVKNGTRSVIVTLGTDNEGKMFFKDILSGNFYNNNVAIFEGVEPNDVEAKYQEVLDDIDAYIMNTGLNAIYKKEIAELLERDRTIVITTIVEYIKTGDVSVIEKLKYYYLQIGGWELGALAITFLVAFILNKVRLGKMHLLYPKRSSLLEMDEKESIFMFTTATKEKEKFVLAEKARREEIKSLARNHLSLDSYNNFVK